MTTLIELSDEPKFNIKSVCTQTGIRAVTLRAWERRHELLNPHRAENRYRQYSERDVAILRWIKDRVDGGMAISSAVNELRAMMRAGIYPEPVVAAPTTKASPPALPPARYIRRLYQALVAHDEGAAGDVFQEIQAGFSLLDLFQMILIPVLVEIGDAWYRGSIRIATEHFASAFIRGKLLTLFQSYPARRGAAHILIGCAPGEQHELGSLMFAVLLRSRGYQVEYLGPDIPLQDLADYAKSERPSLISLSASLEEPALALAGMQDKLSGMRPVPQFAYSGAAFVNHPELKKKVQGIYLGDSLDAGLAAVKSKFPG